MHPESNPVPKVHDWWIKKILLQLLNNQYEVRLTTMQLSFRNDIQASSAEGKKVNSIEQRCVDIFLSEFAVELKFLFVFFSILVISRCTGMHKCCLFLFVLFFFPMQYSFLFIYQGLSVLGRFVVNIFLQYLMPWKMWKTFLILLLLLFIFSYNCSNKKLSGRLQKVKGKYKHLIIMLENTHPCTYLHVQTLRKEA